MGVGDYVHSKEAGPRATSETPSQSRQLRAEQAKVEVPAMKLVAPPAQPPNGHAISSDLQGPTNFQGQSLTPQPATQRDMFDTDVEAADDSTIAGTSVFGLDDNQSQAASSTNAAYANPDPPPAYPRQARRLYRASWYEGLGDKALKKAGFDSDDADDIGSPVTSSVSADDEKPDEANGWYVSHRHRSTDEPLSKRLENFWSASKRASAKAVDSARGDSRLPVAQNPVSDPRHGSWARCFLPLGPGRSQFPVVPPKPSLLDQLEISPTRNGDHATQAGRTLSMTAFQELSDDEDDSEDEMNQTLHTKSRRESGHSANAFDVTNLSNMEGDDDETILDPFSTSSITRRGRRNTVIHAKKRHFDEADYPPQLLYQKSFSELQAEPFDKAPTPVPPPAKSPAMPSNLPLVSDSQSPENTVSRLLSVGDQERRAYLSRLSVDEWEDCGDQIIDRFTHLLSEMKNFRRARRRTAAVFEAEVKRRHDQIEAQDSELSMKLNEMRTGGAEVLRGRNQ
ncbi:hypothetical protein NUU61_009946 [Penicillium alfredii]|uniref:Extracellular mutant protein 11 C-terminal domain-containing protein n=1 Tax=Penicillium alfredii TaxID=1506179 RepID=A0A9W9EH83_9EURO|nr:uncharacterized protein NUU61_009946 [Penicillium alfredii]KAJ5081682.1 hypothetical protein NUU61_009946 [Penicillium alfredii]